MRRLARGQRERHEERQAERVQQHVDVDASGRRRARASPGCSVVTNDSVAPCASTLRTRSPKRAARDRRTRSCTGNRITGASTYHTANATGSHASVTQDEAEERARPTARPRRLSLPRARAAQPAAGSVVRPRHAPDPDQPHDQHVEHDERLPHVLMRPLEHREVPLADVEEADHADDVEELHGDDADREADELVPPRRRETRGSPRSRTSVASTPLQPASIDTAKPLVTLRITLPLATTLAIEQRHDRRRDRGQRVGPRHDEVGLRPRRQLEARTARRAARRTGRRSGPWRRF